MKIRAYDSKVLADTFALAAQIESNIDGMLAEGKNAKAEDLPTSILPTQLLYNIVICYGIMYNLMTESHLIKDGHTKPSTTIH